MRRSAVAACGRGRRAILGHADPGRAALAGRGGPDAGRAGGDRLRAGAGLVHRPAHGLRGGAGPGVWCRRAGAAHRHLAGRGRRGASGAGRHAGAGAAGCAHGPGLCRALGLERTRGLAGCRRDGGVRPRGAGLAAHRCGRRRGAGRQCLCRLWRAPAQCRARLAPRCRPAHGARAAVFGARRAGRRPGRGGRPGAAAVRARQGGANHGRARSSGGGPAMEVRCRP